MKLTPADKWFSKCVRERSRWTCELCGTHYPEGAAKGAYQGLDCSHMIGRGNWSVRFDANNAFAHCTACHFRFGADKELQTSHYMKVFGVYVYDILIQLKNDPKIGRIMRKRKKEIAKYYKEIFECMREKRKGGYMGRLEFPSVP